MATEPDCSKADMKAAVDRRESTGMMEPKTRNLQLEAKAHIEPSPQARLL